METFKSLNITLHDLVSSVDATVCFSKPSPEKWSIAEIVEHVNISDKGAYLAMLKPGPIPTESDLNESKLRIARMLGGAAGAWIAPEAAQPKGKYTSTAALLQDFMKVRNRLERQFETGDPACLAMGLGHPKLGFLTQQQWMDFLIWHTEHHLQQIRGLLLHSGTL